MLSVSWFSSVLLITAIAIPEGLLLGQPPNGSAAFNKPPFFIRNYGGKCLDFGAPPQITGSPVFIFDCNGTIAQEVRIVEPDPSPFSRHTVVLYAGTKVIGVRGPIASQIPLELQDFTGSAAQ